MPWFTSTIRLEAVTLQNPPHFITYQGLLCVHVMYITVNKKILNLCCDVFSLWQQRLVGEPSDLFIFSPGF